MHQAVFSFTFSTAQEVEIVFSSLIPEMKENIQHSSIKATHTGNTLTVKITALDTSSLRAACNSYLRWIETAYNIQTFD